MPSITETAKIARIRRWCAQDDQRLVIPRSQKIFNDLGIHIIDNHLNCVVASHCSIDGLLAEMESLR